MTLVHDTHISELSRQVHYAVYDFYEQHGPILEDELHELAPFIAKRLMPVLEEIAREREYREETA